jgi:hypothetical protein
MLNRQLEMKVSQYIELYDILISEDHMLRQIKELVDFSFIYNELVKNYDETFGRQAKDPIQMFKYLMLKDIYELSDVDLVKRTRCDMSFKYFLDLIPEEVELINPSTLTKFRTLRLKDETLLDKLIMKTVEIAVANGIKLGKALVLDATHTHARYHQKSLEEILLERAKKLRKVVYQFDESLKDKFPKKLISPTIEEVMEYCDQIATVVENDDRLIIRENILNRLNFLREGLNDTQAALEEAFDSDAKVGHKSKDDPFFGYKTHIAMTEERLITAAVITSGEKPDGPELQTLVAKSQESGVEVQEIIGDTAYSGKDNLIYGNDNNIAIISKLNPVISNGNRHHANDFTYNKDADLMVCPAGHMARRKSKNCREKAKKNPRIQYFFDIEKCKHCLQKEGCYKDGMKYKTYSITIKATEYKEQQTFQESQYFKTRYRERYMIEAKNSELKNQHGYGIAKSSGLFGMRIQGAISIFNVNIKRILTLKSQQ